MVRTFTSREENLCFILKTKIQEEAGREVLETECYLRLVKMVEGFFFGE